MSKFGSLLLVLVLAAVGYQAWQTHLLRQEVRDLRLQMAAETAPAGEAVDEESLERAGRLFEEAAKAARQGRLEDVRDAARDAYVLVEPGVRDAIDLAPLLKEFGSAGDYLKKQFKDVYKPQQDGSQ